MPFETPKSHIFSHMVWNSSERHSAGHVWLTFFDFDFAYILQIFKILHFPKNEKMPISVIFSRFLRKVDKNRKKYDVHDLRNVFLNKLPLVPSKSVKNYGLSLPQEIKNKERRKSRFKFFFLYFSHCSFLLEDKASKGTPRLNLMYL